MKINIVPVVRMDIA